MRVMLHNYVNFIWSKVELPEQWKESTTVPVHKNDKNQTVTIISYTHMNSGL
jgi:hypothetical protein